MRRLKAAFFIFFVASLTGYGGIIMNDTRINDDTTGTVCQMPKVAITASDSAIIIWLDQRNGLFNVYGQAFDETGMPIGANFKVSTFSGSFYEYFPSIATFSDSILAVWYFYDGQWLLSDGSQSGSSFEFQNGYQSLNYSSCAVSDSGIFVTWRSSSYPPKVFLQRFDFSGDSLNSKIMLSQDVSGSEQRPKIAGSKGKKDFVAVWEDNRNGESDIYGQIIDPSGNRFGNNFLINDEGTGYADERPDVAMDNAGNFVVVWQDNRDGYEHIYAQLYNSIGGSIGSNFCIDTTHSYMYSPSVAMDSSGKFVVTWEDNRNGSLDIYARIFDASGNPVDTSFRVNQDTVEANGQSYPAISMNGSYFTIAWADQRGGAAYTIYKRRFNINGVPVEDEKRINDRDATSNQLSPSVDVNTSGNVVVTWKDYRSSLPSIYFQQMDLNGNFIGSNRYVGSIGGNPYVYVLENGDFILTWDNYTNINYSFFNSSGVLTDSGIANNTTSNNRYTPKVAFDSLGNFLMVWEDYRNGDADIYGQWFDNTHTKIDTNFKVSDDNSGTGQYYPSVAINKYGKALVIWTDLRDGNYNIYGQLFNSDRTRAGPNFRIDDDTAGTSAQENADIGALPDGRFIVVWEDHRVPVGAYAQIVDTSGALVDSNFKASRITATAYTPKISVAQDGHFVITWRSYTDATYESDIYAQKFNPDCSFDSTSYKVNNNFEGINPSQGYPDVATDGTNVIYVWQDPKWQRGFDIAAKITSSDWTGINENNNYDSWVNVLKVSSPFSRDVSLKYEVVKNCRVKITAYDISGRMVRRLFNGEVQKGIHSVEWNGGEIRNGIYFIRIEAGGSSQAVKIIHLF